MVSFKFTALAIGASLLAESVLAGPASHLGLARRERRLALRAEAGAEGYPNENGDVVSCASGLDSPNADGTCSCGYGREQSEDGKACVFPPEATNPEESFAVFTLQEPVALAIAITTSFPITAPANALTPKQCAAICQAESACIGFYLQPGSPLSQCWKIGGSGAYSDPTTTGIPFTPASSSRLAKRDEGVKGSIGGPGGVLGISEDTQSGSGSSTCLQGVDTPNSDFSCTCGKGRVPDDNNGCKTAPSGSFNGASRRQRRREFEGVQW